MDQLLPDCPPQDKEHVDTFLRELPEIRATGLAYNRGVTPRGSSSPPPAHSAAATSSRG